MPISLDGPRLPAASGKADALVVLLHGYGADGNDLIALGAEWRQALPNAAFVAPHAPEPCAEAPTMGRQWFALSRTDPDSRWRGAQAAHPVLDRFLDEELARTGVAPARLALVGFSQGAMMALHVGLRRKVPPAAILAYSGLLVGPQYLAAEITCRPPVLLVHGEADPVVPFESLALARNALAEAGIACRWHAAAGLGHGIDAAGLEQGGAFLAASLRDAGAVSAASSQG
jgi:phospholipase/carboxylesterase